MYNQEEEEAGREEGLGNGSSSRSRTT